MSRPDRRSARPASAGKAAAVPARRRTRAARPRRGEADLLARAARVKLLLLDVDGVLTDGRLYYSDRGEELKAFDVKDGHALVLLRAHLALGVISGRPGLARRRLEELGFTHLAFGQRDKLAAFADLRAGLGLASDEVAYMGDDVNDLALLAEVGLSAAPADACPEARAQVHFVAGKPGGRGAVRELCELLLRARGLWPY